MHPFNAAQPPRLAILLGYAGLIPFISGAIGIWITPPAWRTDVLTALLHYAAVILAFMGAIHWGLAMARERQDDAAHRQLGLSVLPALLGWLAISSGLPALLALALLISGFIGLYLADVHAVKLELAPRWYTALRKPLTAVVLISLLAAWVGVLVH
ncbi:MAG: DUF3429 domain-containing protein [Pseudomonas sp.]|jgi:hypothetical protein|nr:DUF3429 domain-containing protein [Pseudomonadales bacterium]MDZ7888907.1 DUF3429 domain-containing protein [Pseudomonas sp.]